MSSAERPDRIILVRPGESQGNADDTIYETVPDHALHLTAAGRRQAVDAGATVRGLVRGRLVVYASPYTRAREMVRLMALGVEDAAVRYEPRLREQDWANFQDPATIAVERTQRNAYGHFYYRFTNGESGADVYDRVSSFQESLFRSFARPARPETLVIVTHGLTMRLFCMRWFHWSVEYFESLQNPGNAEVVVLDRQPDGRYRLQRPVLRWDASYTPSDAERATWAAEGSG